jgi:hypothetical protein
MEQLQEDSYVNLKTLLGIRGADKSTASSFQIRDLLDWDVLKGMYGQDAIAARIIDRLPDDATREAIKLKGVDTDFDFSSVLAELEKLNARIHIGDAWRWARLYRGSLLLMIVNDGRKMDEPLDLANATKLSSLHVLEARFVIPDIFNPGLGSAAFARPEFYMINVPHSKGDDRKIHNSRVIRFDGVKVTPSEMIENGGWGPSVLDRINTEVTGLGVIMGYARNIMHNLSMQGIQLEGYRDMLCGGADGKSNAMKIVQALYDTMDQLHLIALDTKDKFIEITRTVTGLTDLIKEFIDALVRATDMPRTVLLGEAPGGLNASGDSELRSWYDYVSGQQPQKLTPPINRLVEVILATRKNEQTPDQWEVEYAPLWQSSAKEKAETDKIKAETADIYTQMGVISVPEVRTKLIQSGDLPDDAGDEPPIDESAEELEELKGQMAELALAAAKPALPEPEPEPEPEPVEDAAHSAPDLDEEDEEEDDDVKA